MTRKHELSPASRLDLIAIEDWTYEHFGLEQALLIHDELTACFVRLAENPSLGHFWEDLSPPDQVLRYWLVKNRLLVLCTILIPSLCKSFVCCTEREILRRSWRERNNREIGSVVGSLTGQDVIEHALCRGVAKPQAD